MASRVHEEINMEELELICSTCVPPLTVDTRNYDNDGDESGGEGDCDRDLNNSKDVLSKMKFGNWETWYQVNSWFDGGPTIKVTIVFGDSTGNVTKLTKIFTGKDRDFRKDPVFGPKELLWFDMNSTIVTWTEGEYGNKMLYNWIEMDSGEEQTISTTFSSSYKQGNNTITVQHTATIKTTDKDDQLGEAIIEYCDNTEGEGEEYDTGNKVFFFVRQKD